MKSRLFKPDKYTDRKGADYWLKFQYPYWWGNLLTVLDSLSVIGFPAEDQDISKGLSWFADNQLDNGFWPTGYGKGQGADPNQAWVALAIGKTLYIS